MKLVNNPGTAEQAENGSTGFSHFVEFRENSGVNGSPHPVGQFRAASAIVDVVHLENGSRSRIGQPGLGVAFPALVEGGRNAMGVVRVFGGQASLEALLIRASSICGKQSVGGGGYDLSASKVSRVPSDHSWASFVRDRSADRDFPGYCERAMSRAQRKAMARIARGESVTNPPIGIAERMERLADRNLAAVGEVRTYLKLDSNSTGRSFALFVRVVHSAEFSTKGVLDIYGLSVRMVGNGSDLVSPVQIPHF